jgi:pyridoxal phosphate-dependent aminotransferase EpsN
MPRIYLSPPHMSGFELELVNDAFATNWIAPLGPHAAARSSGTAALHLAIRLAGVGRGDEVLDIHD